ncbi:ABC transporter [Longibacter salinarum]|uniref:ABC transporter n=1 Tax=Longibacter salinarum TaxID=1850348 RepID=A0A2A8D0Z6_9BACT|nr:ABC transporter ATP-binding protein [Longibacter salinarum]PEN14550.1 ABC transporter [Longibacter salinarum]
MPAPAVAIEGLSHRYGSHEALSDLSLHIEEGALHGLLGPNGSGKTTLFRILSTLMPPSEGQASVFGLSTTDEPSAVRARLGSVFQDYALDENLSVRENLRFQGALYGLRGEALQERIKHLLTLFDVYDRADDRVDTLSGGLQRRVDLARGLLHRPELLLLDEPTTGLDPMARRTFWQAIDRLREDEGTTLLVATHLMEEAERCDQVAILANGRLVANGSPDALKAELGGEMLWIESDDPSALRDHIESQFGIRADIAGESLQIAHEDAPQLLSSLYEALGDHIRSATVRQPTLEDVFVSRAGVQPDDEPKGVLRNS